MAHVNHQGLFVTRGWVAANPFMVRDGSKCVLMEEGSFLLYLTLVGKRGALTTCPKPENDVYLWPPTTISRTERPGCLRVLAWFYYKPESLCQNQIQIKSEDLQQSRYVRIFENGAQKAPQEVPFPEETFLKHQQPPLIFCGLGAASIWWRLTDFQ